MQYRRVWRGTAITSVVNPVFYLGALGVGLGTLVNKTGGVSLGVSYIDFVAPGMLAATAMTIASNLLQRHIQTLVADNVQWQTLIADDMVIRLLF